MAVFKKLLGKIVSYHTTVQVPLYPTAYLGRFTIKSKSLAALLFGHIDGRGLQCCNFNPPTINALLLLKPQI